MESLVNWANFYRGKRVLLTGHTGFKGSWLALWLLELGAHVHGYSLLPPTDVSLFGEAKIARHLATHEIADIRDAERLYRTLAAVRPEIVFHLAAQSLVRRSYLEPRETYETNVMGTVNLLDAVRRVPGIRVCQVITSDKCYENREWVYPYRENDPMGGADPYSSSKGCAELVVSAYRHSFFPPEQISRHGVSLASARAGNVIGGGDWAEDRIIPDCICALQANQPIIVRNPDAIRPWQHVLEPLSGYLLLAARQWNAPALFAEGWNFGPLAADNVNVRHIVERAIRLWGGGTWTDASQSGGSAPAATRGTFHEARFLKLDVTKAVSVLGWRPRFGVDEAIAQTVQWYRQRAAEHSAFRADDVTIRQIRSYMAAEHGVPGGG